MFQSSRTTSGILASQRDKRFLAVAGLVDLELERLEDVPGDLADHLRIIDDQTALHACSFPLPNDDLIKR